jgi:hypothetical protein
MSSDAPVKEDREDTQKPSCIGERFQAVTKYLPDRMGRHDLDWEHMPERNKNYPGNIDALSRTSLFSCKINQSAIFLRNSSGKAISRMHNDAAMICLPQSVTRHLRV